LLKCECKFRTLTHLQRVLLTPTTYLEITNLHKSEIVIDFKQSIEVIRLAFNLDFELASGQVHIK